ncbi:MAG: phosphatidylinositol kinase [Kiritimatiellaeota bacterium]|nr:phosphatidylinositol kinase [Kiritimatiellota bacterium]
MRSAKVCLFDKEAGILTESEEGYTFRYLKNYLKDPNAAPISLLLPLRAESYKDKTLFPFFDGLIPEGWLLDIAVRNWKLDDRDRMGLLLSCCRETIGAASIVEITGNAESEADAE